jgi:putative transcriptional regulator
MSKAGKRLLEAAREALAIARGEKKPARIYVPADIDVKAIRQKTELSQEDFAYTFGFTSNQIKDWEQGRSRPLGGVRSYLMIIDRDPGLVLDLLRTAMKKAA